MVLSLHIGAGFDVIQARRRGSRRPPHGARLPDQRDHRAGPALRPDAAALPRPEGRAVRGRHRLDPVLLRSHRPPLHRTRRGCTTAGLRRASCPSEVFREHILACYITDPSGLMLRDRHRHRHHRVGVRLPAHRHDVAGVAGVRLEGVPGRRAAPTSEIHKITWENSCRFFDWDPFKHTPKEQATVGALRAIDRRRHHADVPRGVAQAQRGRRHRRLLIPLSHHAFPVPAQPPGPSYWSKGPAIGSPLKLWRPGGDVT